MSGETLILTRPGHRRKHDHSAAIELAKRHRAGLLIAIRIPSEAEERVRDLVRFREPFQREILSSRDILKFLRRRGFLFRDGSNWTQKDLHWLRSLLRKDELVAEDRDVLGEYLALLEHKIDGRDELDRKIERITLTPAYQEAVDRLHGFLVSLDKNEHGLWRAPRRGRERVEDQVTLAAVNQNLKRLVSFGGRNGRGDPPRQVPRPSLGLSLGL